MTLQPADILIWRVDSSANRIDRFIGWGESLLHEKTPQGYQYYHVAFVSPNPKQIYSSQPPKINRYPVDDPFPPYIEVYRLKVTPSPDQLARIFRYAESRRGRPYPFAGVLTAGWLQGNLEFCSQYTEDSFAEGGYLLAPNIRFTSPDAIAASLMIQRVL